jgi:hypothetical protein
MANELDRIQEWYRAQCDGEWEHSYGVKIDTLDNPGWAVSIDLKGTALEHAPMDTVLRDQGPDDWIRLEVKAAVFLGNGDPGKLTAMLAAFLEWATRHQPDSA